MKLCTVRKGEEVFPAPPILLSSAGKGPDFGGILFLFKMMNELDVS